MGGVCGTADARIDRFDNEWDKFDESDRGLLDKEEEQDVTSRKEPPNKLRRFASTVIPEGEPPMPAVKHAEASFESELDWHLYLDENRRPYFWSPISGQSQWTVPPELADHEVFS